MMNVTAAGQHAKEILEQEVAFHPLSYCDERGRLFWWNGSLYRGIAPAYVPFYRQLFENGTVGWLIAERYLVETEPTEFTTPLFPFIVKHRVLPFVSYANEWCSGMLRDAGLFLLEVNTELAKHGLTLSSANPWSVLFEGCRPLLVDFCDIVSLDEDGVRTWERFRDEYYMDFIYPLRLMVEGKGDLARWILADYEHQDVHKQFAAIMRYRVGTGGSNLVSRMWSRTRRLVHRNREISGDNTAAGHVLPRMKTIVVDGLERLRRETEQIRFESPRLTPHDEWREESLTMPREDWNEKQRGVHALLVELKPRTVLIVGCGRERYSYLAASFGARVIAIDRVEKKVNDCYAAARRHDLSVHPLVMNLCYPTPGFGIANATLPPATQRLACELVLALDLVHHLVLEQSRTFEQVVEAVAGFTTRWAVIEFALPHDTEVSPWLGQRQAWYSLESFLSALQRRFRVQRVVESPPASRVIVVCEIKET